MKMNGARILWECLVREGVQTLFGITGGKVIPLYHELLNYPIRHITMRHEQAAAHAADGYARATGRVAYAWPPPAPAPTNRHGDRQRPDGFLAPGGHHRAGLQRRPGTDAFRRWTSPASPCRSSLSTT